MPNAYDAHNFVGQYTIDPDTGILSTPTFVSAGNQLTAVAVEPSSKFAYVANRVDNTVSIFTIDPGTGSLTQRGTIASGASPFNVVVDPSGRFVYVANEGSGVSIYTLGQNGALAPAGGAAPASGRAIDLAVTRSR